MGTMQPTTATVIPGLRCLSPFNRYSWFSARSSAARRTLLESAAQDAEMARRALMALLSLSPPQGGSAGGDSALTDAHALALARAAFPGVAWETINAIARARRAPLAPIIRLALAPAPDQPA
ncbi:MAG: hypothetical protein NZ518_07935, partial [Dehalococcoidia bacterium]|nr:hypothetical protein [Dehalococcoidia bacterium]